MSVTFDQSRYECHMSKKTTLPDLPPTSHSTQMHLLRCHFVVRQSILLLNGSFDEKAIKFGWSIESGYLRPVKNLLGLPSYYYIKCGCTKRCT